MSAKPDALFCSLVAAAATLITRGLAGCPLWAALLRDCHATVREAARRESGRRKVWLDPDDVLNEMTVEVGARVRRTGGAAFTFPRWVNHDGPEYLAGLLIREIGFAASRLLRANPPAVPIEVVAEPEGAGAAPGAALESEEERAALLLRVNALPDAERRLVVGHCVEGRSVGVLAKELGMSRTTGYVLLRRALGRLRGE